jgi:menaquinol-cytochrome c reductase iron-sulfur subunit
MNPDSIQASEPSPCETSRRRFLSRLSVLLGSIAGAIVAIPSVAFLLGLRKVPSVWRTVGKLDDFQIGNTVKVAFLDPSPLPWAGVTARTAAWLRRTSEQEFIAFSVDCTHLGCPVRWLPDANLFMCPCHGGVYYANGAVASGPPPKPLPTYPVRVKGGMVQILTSPLPITSS